MANLIPLDDARIDAAAAWHVRLEGDAGEDDWRAFTAWLEADPKNRVAFDDVCAASADIENQKDALASALTKVSAEQAIPRHDAQVIPFAGMRSATALHSSQPPVHNRTMRAWAAGIAAVAAALLLTVFIRGDLIDSPHVQSWQTHVGEHQTAVLEDGSEIQLNTDTAVSVSFTRKLRSVRLEHGEAHFDVTSNPRRPFSVAVGDRQVDVVGTAFSILRSDGKLAVTVARGIVKVGPNSVAEGAKAAHDASVRLTVGDQYSGREGEAAYQVVKVDPATALAWRNGRLIYDDATLFQVISDLNRYFDRKLVVGDEATGAMRFTGILKVDDEASLVKRLESLLPVTVQTRGDDLVLARRLPD